MFKFTDLVQVQSDSTRAELFVKNVNCKQNKHFQSLHWAENATPPCFLSAWGCRATAGLRLTLVPTDHDVSALLCLTP